MDTSRVVAAGCALAVGIDAVWIRPRLLRAGATDEELREPFPGAELIPGGTRTATMAVTIDAPPGQFDNLRRRAAGAAARRPRGSARDPSTRRASGHG